MFYLSSLYIPDATLINQMNRSAKVSNVLPLKNNSAITIIPKGNSPTSSTTNMSSRSLISNRAKATWSGGRIRGTRPQPTAEARPYFQQRLPITATAKPFFHQDSQSTRSSLSDEGSSGAENMATTSAMIQDDKDSLSNDNVLKSPSSDYHSNTNHLFGNRQEDMEHDTEMAFEDPDKEANFSRPRGQDSVMDESALMSTDKNWHHSQKEERESRTFQSIVHAKDPKQLQSHVNIINGKNFQSFVGESNKLARHHLQVQSGKKQKEDVNFDRSVAKEQDHKMAIGKQEIDSTAHSEMPKSDIRNSDNKLSNMVFNPNERTTMHINSGQVAKTSTKSFHSPFSQIPSHKSLDIVKDKGISNDALHSQLTDNMMKQFHKDHVLKSPSFQPDLDSSNAIYSRHEQSDMSYQVPESIRKLQLQKTMLDRYNEITIRSTNPMKYEAEKLKNSEVDSTEIKKDNIGASYMSGKSPQNQQYLQSYATHTQMSSDNVNSKKLRVGKSMSGNNSECSSSYDPEMHMHMKTFNNIQQPTGSSSGFTSSTNTMTEAGIMTPSKSPYQSVGSSKSEYQPVDQSRSEYQSLESSKSDFDSTEGNKSNFQQVDSNKVTYQSLDSMKGNYPLSNQVKSGYIMDHSNSNYQPVDTGKSGFQHMEQTKTAFQSMENSKQNYQQETPKTDYQGVDQMKSGYQSLDPSKTGYQPLDTTKSGQDPLPYGGSPYSQYLGGTGYYSFGQQNHPPNMIPFGSSFYEDNQYERSSHSLPQNMKETQSSQDKTVPSMQNQQAARSLVSQQTPNLTPRKDSDAKEVKRDTKQSPSNNREDSRSIASPGSASGSRSGNNSARSTPALVTSSQQQVSESPATFSSASLATSSSTSTPPTNFTPYPGHQTPYEPMVLNSYSSTNCQYSSNGSGSNPFTSTGPTNYGNPLRPGGTAPPYGTPPSYPPYPPMGGQYDAEYRASMYSAFHRPEPHQFPPTDLGATFPSPFSLSPHHRAPQPAPTNYYPQNVYAPAPYTTRAGYPTPDPPYYGAPAAPGFSPFLNHHLHQHPYSPLQPPSAAPSSGTQGSGTSSSQ